MTTQVHSGHTALSRHAERTPAAESELPGGAAGAASLRRPPGYTADPAPTLPSAPTIVAAHTPAALPFPPTIPGAPMSAGPAGAFTPAQRGSSGDAVMRQVGRYQILSRLGRGGMATVYRAHDPQIGRDVAIKFLHASLAQEGECHARFLQESRAAGGLSHPNIVIVHDVGEIEGRPYMAMELIDGVPLFDVMERSRQMPFRQAAAIGRQLADALDYAHAHGIVHRDIKPGNIMVLRDGQSIKVTDFGIAHMAESAHQHTQVGAVLGTPQYMSPEQTRGEKLDGRSDLFSTGIVLYQMLTGERPFRGDNLVALATRIAGEEPPALALLRPDTPASLRRVVDRCLAKVPAQRYQSGKELAAALGKVVTELDEAARTRAQPRQVPLRVKWALAMAAVVAVVMGLTAAVITQRQYAAMMGQAIDNGAALARFIARQNAQAALGEEWEVVDVAVQEMMKTGSFERIVVVDPNGVVRASSLPGLVNLPYRAAGTTPLEQLGGNAAVVRYSANDERVLGFEAPLMFQDKLVGKVALGLPERPLLKVAQLSITLMVVLALVTVAAVAAAMYLLGDWFARPIRLVSESMGELAKGRFDHRIGEQRKDEFGELFAAYDAMAMALEQRYGGPRPRPSTLPTQGPGTMTPLPSRPSRPSRTPEQ